jgi:hypothetical protein
VSALAALGDDARVQKALLGEIGRGWTFFRGAVSRRSAGDVRICALTG